MTSPQGALHRKIDRQTEKEHQRVDEVASRIHRNIDEQALVDHKHVNKEMIHNEKQRMHDIQHQHELELAAKRHPENHGNNDLTQKQLAEIKRENFEADLNKKKILHQKQKEQEERLIAIRHKNLAVPAGDDNEQLNSDSNQLYLNDVSRYDQQHHSTRSKTDTHVSQLTDFKEVERHKIKGKENKANRKRSEKELKVVDIHSRLTLEEVHGGKMVRNSICMF